MSKLGDIRNGLAANLDSLKRVLGGQVSPYVLSNPTLPVIWIHPAQDQGIAYHQAMGNGREDWRMTVQAFVGTPSDIGAQQLLDTLLDSTGANSVKAAIESDTTLGGKALDLIVEECRGYQEYARPDGSTALGADWTVRVTVSGNS